MSCQTYCFWIFTQEKLIFCTKSRSSTEYYVEITQKQSGNYFLTNSYHILGPNQLMLWTMQATITTFWTRYQAAWQERVALKEEYTSFWYINVNRATGICDRKQAINCTTLLIWEYCQAHRKSTRRWFV